MFMIIIGKRLLQGLKNKYSIVLHKQIDKSWGTSDVMGMVVMNKYET